MSDDKETQCIWCGGTIPGGLHVYCSAECQEQHAASQAAKEPSRPPLAVPFQLWPEREPSR